MVVAGAGLLTLLFAFGLRHDPSIVRSPLVGRPAPDVSLPRLDGSGSISLASLRGQVVVVNFWASWCVPCRQENADLQAAWGRFRDHGVVVVGVSYQDDRSAALAFQRELGGDWPLVADPGSRAALAFGVTGVPETFVIDRSGTIVSKSYGAVSYPTLSEQLTRLIPGGAS